MKLFLVERKHVFGITNGVFRKTVCFSPTTDRDHDKKYCKVLGKILKEKHVKSKDLDLMIQFILPVPGKSFGSIRIYDAFFTLKTLGGILNDPDMKIVVSISSPILLGRGVFINTKEMPLDPNAFPIIPICKDDHVNLDKLHPILDMLQDGSTSMFISVSLEFESRRRQEILSKSPSVGSAAEQERKSNGEPSKCETKGLETTHKEPLNQSKNPDIPCGQLGMQLKEIFDHSKEQVSDSEKLLCKPNPVAKAKRRIVKLNQAAQFELQNDLPESIRRTIFQLSLEEADAEEQMVEPEKLEIKSEPPVQKLVEKSVAPNLTEVKSEAHVVVPPTPIEVSAELSICKKILQEEISSDAIILTKEGSLVNCHKSFLMAHSKVFIEMFKKDVKLGHPTNTLELSDMTEKGVRALLAYLYCWDQSKARDCSSVAFELLSASNKYDIPLLMTSMRNLFLDKSSDWYEPDVIVKLFLFARKLSIEEGADLKQKAINLMKENLPQIEQCSTYKELFKESPEVAMELCRIAFSA